MYRVQQRALVKYGKFREYHSTMEQLNEIARQRGWTEGLLLVPLAGLDNEYIIHWDYPTFAQLEREQEQFYSDVEAMKVFRSAAEFVVEGTSHSEILQGAITIS